MSSTKQDKQRSPEVVIRSLMRIDSSIRNGQFLSAYREANKLLAELSRGEYDIGIDDVAIIGSSIKRTVLFLHPMVDAYAQNQSSLNIIRRLLKWKKNQILPEQTPSQ